MLERLWALTPDTPLDGEEPSCSYVTAVQTANGTSAVLKISMPHMEGEHEIHGLRFWQGDPTVRLVEADDKLSACFWSVVGRGPVTNSCRARSGCRDLRFAASFVAAAARTAPVSPVVSSDRILG